MPGIPCSEQTRLNCPDPVCTRLCRHDRQEYRAEAAFAELAAEARLWRQRAGDAGLMIVRLLHNPCVDMPDDVRKDLNDVLGPEVVAAAERAAEPPSVEPS